MLSALTSIIRGSLPEKIRAIARAGFDGIDLPVSEITSFNGGLERIAELLAAADLQIASLGPVKPPLTPARLATKLEMARALSATTIVVEPDNVDALSLPNAEMLRGIRIALRPTRETEAALLQFLAEQDNPLIGLSLNSFEALANGSRPARLRDLDGCQIFHVQMVDGTREPRLPAQGTLNLAGLARILARCGYLGPWSVGTEAQGPGSALNAYRALANLLFDAAQTEPTLRPMAPALPPKARAEGIEFVEFAVDHPGARELEALLSAMAFRHERRHLTKKVTLWRQGAVNIVINEEDHGHAHHAFLGHGPTVCGVGLRVGNAAETVARAKALGIEDFAQEVGLGELTIPAIRGIGGSVIHFIDEKSDLHRVWDIEFEPVRRTEAATPAGLRRIDHIAQTMDYDDMQGWLLYYLSTFEMTKSSVVNVADPSGITRSQAIESPEGKVRLNLNGAADQNTMAGSFLSEKLGAGVQHIAFLTDDIIETSARLASRGFDRLDIPRHYYTETRDEFDLDDTLIATLQAANILYDEDDGGQFFQLYSRSVFDGFFFEIVERRGRYAGYGARNAPIRLAAQTQAKTGGRVAC